MKKLFLFIVCLTLTLTAFSQDYVITNSGKKVDGNITRVDSSRIYMTLHSNGREVYSFFNKKDISSVHFGSNKSANIMAAPSQSSPVKVGSAAPTSDGIQYSDGNAKDKIIVNLGLGIPVGSFCQEDGGAANTGFTYNFYYRHFYSEGKGIGLKIFESINSLNKSDILDEVNGTSGTNWDISNSPCWNTFGLLTGLTYDFYNNSSTSVGFDILIGPMCTTAPEIKATLSSSSSVWAKQNSATAFGLGYNVGFNLSRSISDHYFFYANVDYMRCYFSFGKIKGSNSYGYEAEGSDESVKFQVINLTAGIGYTF